MLYVRIVLTNFAMLAATGDEGEDVRAFTHEEVRVLDDFFPNHTLFLKATLDFLGVKA